MNIFLYSSFIIYNEKLLYTNSTGFYVKYNLKIWIGYLVWNFRVANYFPKLINNSNYSLIVYSFFLLLFCVCTSGSSTKFNTINSFLVVLLSSFSIIKPCSFCYSVVFVVDVIWMKLFYSSICIVLTNYMPISIQLYKSM